MVYFWIVREMSPSVCDEYLIVRGENNFGSNLLTTKLWVTTFYLR